MCIHDWYYNPDLGKDKLECSICEEVKEAEEESGDDHPFLIAEVEEEE